MDENDRKQINKISENIQKLERKTYADNGIARRSGSCAMLCIDFSRYSFLNRKLINPGPAISGSSMISSMNGRNPSTIFMAQSLCSNDNGNTR